MTTTTSAAAAPARGGPVRGEPPWLRRYSRWVVGVVIALVVAWWAFDRLFGFMITLLCSFFVAFAVEPATNWLAARGWKRSVATLSVFFAVGVGVTVFLLAVGSLIVSQIADLAQELPVAIDELDAWLDDEFGIDLSTGFDSLRDQLGSYGTEIASTVVGVGVSAIGVVFQIFTIALFAYYLTSQGPSFRRAVCSILPPNQQREALRVWAIAIDKTAGFLYSRILLGALSAICTGVFLYVVGVPYALTLGLFVGIVSQFIPTVGTYIAGAAAVLVALTVSPATALIVLLFVIAYQQVENYLFSPRLSSHAMEIHPAVAFGGVIVGAALLGAVGAFLALPLVATIQAFVSTYVTRHDLVDDDLLRDTEKRLKAARELGPTDEG